jgi:hypothetical protein
MAIKKEVKPVIKKVIPKPKAIIKKPIVKKTRKENVNDKTDTNKKNLLIGLEKSLGIVTSACKNAGVSRETHYKYMREDLEYSKAVKDIEEIAKDFAETQLHKQINEGNVTSIIFYLKSKAKDRGYIERVENLNTNINHDNIPLDPSQIKKLSDELDNEF